MFRKLGLEIVKREKVHPAVQIFAVVFGLLLAFVISGWIINLTGSDPIESFKVMFRGCFWRKKENLKLFDEIHSATTGCLGNGDCLQG